jgi:glycosyltransferase involved in cell wall biosynthesis
MDNNFLVSICIPAYNHPAFLKKCLKSIVSQTYSNFEVIITDDSTHDELSKIVTEFNDDRIKYDKNATPLGSPKNWNYCISLAKGDLIKILHHDDWFVSDSSLREYVDYFIKYPNTDFAFSQCYNVSSTNIVIHAISNKLASKIIKKPLLLLFANFIGAPSNIIFTKEISERLSFNQKSSWYVDVIFYIEVLAAGRNVKYINKPLVNITTESQFQVTNSISGLKKTNEAIYVFEMFNSVYTDFKLLTYLQLLDIFSRYKVKNLKELEIDNYRTIVKNAFFLSKININYKVYALLRRTFVKYFT